MANTPGSYLKGKNLLSHDTQSIRGLDSREPQHPHGPQGELTWEASLGSGDRDIVRSAGVEKPWFVYMLYLHWYRNSQNPFTASIALISVSTLWVNVAERIIPHLRMGILRVPEMESPPCLYTVCWQAIGAGLELGSISFQYATLPLYALPDSKEPTCSDLWHGGTLKVIRWTVPVTDPTCCVHGQAIFC